MPLPLASSFTSMQAATHPRSNPLTHTQAWATHNDGGSAGTAASDCALHCTKMRQIALTPSRSGTTHRPVSAAPNHVRSLHRGSTVVARSQEELRTTIKAEVGTTEGAAMVGQAKTQHPARAQQGRRPYDNEGVCMHICRR